MRLYHVTDRASSEAILQRGFEDAEVIHDDREVLIGVWLADRCLAGEDDVGPRIGPVADVALQIEVPAHIVEAYERRKPGKPYREFCVPAKLVNRHEVAAVRDLEDTELTNDAGMAMRSRLPRTHLLRECGIPRCACVKRFATGFDRRTSGVGWRVSPARGRGNRAVG